MSEEQINTEEFSRESRYVVFSRKDCDRYLNPIARQNLAAIAEAILQGRQNDGKKDHSFVCVRDDWPMFESVWQAIEQFAKFGSSGVEFNETGLRAEDLPPGKLIDPQGVLLEAIPDPALRQVQAQLWRMERKLNLIISADPDLVRDSEYDQVCANCLLPAVTDQRITRDDLVFCCEDCEQEFGS